MSNLLALTATGRLGRDPSLKETANGQSVLNFSMATTRAVKGDGGYEQETLWLDVKVWGARAAALANVLAKGDLVSVSGSFWPRTYKRRDGGEGVSYEVQANAVHREARPTERGEPARARATEPSHEARFAEPETEDDELPF